MTTKILSLDGGGSWSLIQAIALADIYGLDTPGREILNKFDLAVANSGGSIVLAGLIANMSPRTIFDLFNSSDKRNPLFVKKLFHSPITPKYDTDKKLSGLTNIFHDDVYTKKSLNELYTELNLKTDIVICSFDYDRERAKIFRSNSNSLAASGEKPNRTSVTLVQAIHASSTAPVHYFDDPALIKPSYQRFWDGGVGGYNNPVMAGITEVLSNNQNDEKIKDNIKVLSIGTGSVFLPLWNVNSTGDEGLYKEPQDSTTITDIELLAHAIINDPPDAASFVAHVVLNGRLPKSSEETIKNSSLVRMNPLVQPKGPYPNWSYPGDQTDLNSNKLSSKDFSRLIKLELDAVEQTDVDLIKKFTKLWLQGYVTNQAIRADSETLKCEIGHDNYEDALKQWQSLNGGSLPASLDNRQEIIKLLTV